jgi:hypothetical protein
MMRRADAASEPLQGRALRRRQMLRGQVDLARRREWENARKAGERRIRQALHEPYSHEYRKPVQDAVLAAETLESVTILAAVPPGFPGAKLEIRLPSCVDGRRQHKMET